MTAKSLTYVLSLRDNFTGPYRKAGKEAESSNSAISGSISKAGLAWLGMGTVAVGAIKSMIANSRSLGTAGLKQAAKDAGISWAGFSVQVKKAGKSMSDLGFTQADTNKSLKTLVTSTGSSKASLNALGAAADLARYKGIGLTDASAALGKAAMGNTRALKELGVSTNDLPKHFSTTGTAASRMGIIVDLMTKKIGGQASTYAAGFGGKLDVLKAKLFNVSASIGSALLPILSKMLGMISDKVLPVIQRFSDWFQSKGAPAIENFTKKVMPVVVGVFAYFVTGITNIIKAAGMLPGPLKIAGLAIIGLGIAMKLAASANPWILLAVAIVTITGIIIKHWTTIKDKTTEVFDAIAHGVAQFGIWIVRGMKTVTDAVLTFYGWIVHGAAKAFGWIPGIGGKLKAASAAFDNMRGAVDKNFDQMIGTMSKWRDGFDYNKKKSDEAQKAIVGDFNKQRIAAGLANTALKQYSGAISKNKVDTEAAKVARNKLVTDLIAAGVNSNKAKADVNNYTNAVRTNGKDSDAARNARMRLNADIKQAFVNSQQGRRDIANLTAAVKYHSANSDAVRGARQRLLTDLINAGVDAKTAKRLVDTMQTSINNMKGKTVDVNVRGGGSGGTKVTISQVGGGPFAGKLVALSNRLASGGQIRGPGGPTADLAGIFALSNEEWVINAAAAKKYGYRAMDAVNKGKAFIGLASGGSVNSARWADSAENSFAANVGSAYTSVTGNAYQGVVNAVIKGLLSSLGGAGGAGSNAAWDSVILQALALLHQPASWLGVVRHRLMQESGGNATIVNKWDSNWVAGTPSVGGMQVIGPTFAAYAGPFRNVGPFLYGVSVNRLANMYAGLNYALHRYGSLSALMRPGGYAKGTRSARRGWAWVGERGPELMHFGGGEQIGSVAGTRRGTTTYVLNISATPLARPADIGREVVGAIREFERGAGKGWRT